jgi:hypothetical protein
MPSWIVQFVFEGAEGDAEVSLTRVDAETKEEARDLAAKKAPGEDFVIASVVPESDEQFLGTVKHQAIMMSGKKTPVPNENE